MLPPLSMSPGSPSPLGARPVEGGVNFAVVSRNAAQVYVSIFDESGEEELYRLALPGRLGDVHYGFVAGLGPGTRYGLRADGPWDERAGHRFDMTKLLVDPYAAALDRPFHHQPDLTTRGFDTAPLVPKAIVAPVPEIVTRGPARRPHFIYEVPVKAFTKLHPQVPEKARGTVAALAEPTVIAHFKRLGVDTIELMPLAAWIDERHLPPLELQNAWGYNPVCFMAPDPRLAPGGFAEIRDTVAKLHAEGFQVILDVVFNHTGESDERGATLSLRGLDNALYYRLDAEGRLVNDTGCGNTLGLRRAPVVQLVLDALRLWAGATGIDGFRFDLATTLGRDEQGFLRDAPALAAILQDPALKDLILIAEPWDVGAGGYQLGQFPGAWMEWNDRYRNEVRRFWRGDAGSINALATRLAGSADIFAASHRPPSASVNYAAAHDGFTLRDAVTFAVKNNIANGENDRDGNAGEPSWPGGDARALLATLFLSRGTPMLTAGDEFGRSQKGNNNAYAQDNALTWLDWETADQALIDFTAQVIRLRSIYPLLASDRFLTDGDAHWFGADGGPVTWADPQTRVLGLVLSGDGPRLALWINGSDAAVTPAIKAADGHRWTRVFASREGGGLPPQSVALFAEELSPSSGVSDDTLVALAEAAGINRDWWEVDGTHHIVTPDSLRAMLTALRIPHGTPSEAREQLAQLKARVAPLIVRAGESATLAPPSDRKARYVVEAEDGTRHVIDTTPGTSAAATLAPGYYRLWREDNAAQSRHVIASPGTCHLPEDMADGRRVFGLAAHLYALRHAGDGGIGDFETLRRFGGLVKEIGGRYAGLNPLHHLFPGDRERASPYQPSDRRFVDPIYISIPRLLEKLALPRAQALAEARRAAFAGLERLPLVDYPAVWKAKVEILEAAYLEFKPDADFEQFVAAGGEMLARHGAFEAYAAGEAETPQRIRYRAFLQWIADRQLGQAGDMLYRDLALGCAFDGGERAEQPQVFVDGVSLGAPPDPFSAAGQIWNLPPQSPLALLESGLAPLRAVLAANMRHAAALRIDHALGFMRQFWIPEGAPASAGAYVRFPLAAMIAVAAIESRKARCLVIGEDLGTVPEGLRAALAAANILSYRVLWFEREGQGFKPPASYPRQALACLASHDLPTFMGWRRGRDIEIDQELGRIDATGAARRRAERSEEIAALDTLSACPGADDTAAAVAAHGLVASTPSLVMLAQADDLAGETEPLNVPGTDRERPNWRRRIALPVDALQQSPLAGGIIARLKGERP